MYECMRSCMHACACMNVCVCLCLLSKQCQDVYEIRECAASCAMYDVNTMHCGHLMDI